MKTFRHSWDSLVQQASAILRRRQELRGSARGVTLIEVIIVVTIIAMVAGGVAVFALPKLKEAEKKSAKTGCQVVRQAAMTWQSSNTGCPTISQLYESKDLDPGQKADDPWAQPYQITCVDDLVVVSSSGPDKKKGTADDIQIPEAAAGTQP